MRRSDSSDVGSQKLTPPGDDDPASFPAPPPLPRERAAAQAKRQAKIPPPPPLVSLATASKPQDAGRSSIEAQAESAGMPPLTQDAVAESPPGLPPELPAKTPAEPPPELPAAPPLASTPASLALEVPELPPPRRATSPQKATLSSALPAPPSPPPRQARSPQRPWLLYAVAVLLVLAVGGTVFLLLDRSETPPGSEAQNSQEPEDAPKELDTPTTDLVGGGKLLIDASPWGEVTSLVDGEGRDIELPPDRQTPLVLALAPGRYTAHLTHPELVNQSKPCEAEVSATHGASCRVDLVPASVDDYWEGMGWLR